MMNSKRILQNYSTTQELLRTFITFFGEPLLAKTAKRHLNYKKNLFSFKKDKKSDLNKILLN